MENLSFSIWEKPLVFPAEVLGLVNDRKILSLILDCADSSSRELLSEKAPHANRYDFFAAIDSGVGLKEGTYLTIGNILFAEGDGGVEEKALMDIVHQYLVKRKYSPSDSTPSAIRDILAELRGVFRRIGELTALGVKAVLERRGIKIARKAKKPSLDEESRLLDEALGLDEKSSLVQLGEVNSKSIGFFERRIFKKAAEGIDEYINRLRKGVPEFLAIFREWVMGVLENSEIEGWGNLRSNAQKCRGLKEKLLFGALSQPESRAWLEKEPFDSMALFGALEACKGDNDEARRLLATFGMKWNVEIAKFLKKLVGGAYRDSEEEKLKKLYERLAARTEPNLQIEGSRMLESMLLRLEEELRNIDINERTVAGVLNETREEADLARKELAVICEILKGKKTWPYKNLRSIYDEIAHAGLKSNLARNVEEGLKQWCRFSLRVDERDYSTYEEAQMAFDEACREKKAAHRILACFSGPVICRRAISRFAKGKPFGTRLALHLRSFFTLFFTAFSFKRSMRWWVWPGSLDLGSSRFSFILRHAQPFPSSEIVRKLATLGE